MCRAHYPLFLVVSSLLGCDTLMENLLLLKNRWKTNLIRTKSKERNGGWGKVELTYLGEYLEIWNVGWVGCVGSVPYNGFNGDCTVG